MARHTIEFDSSDIKISENGHPAADRVFRIFQEAAERQTELLGIGPKDLLNKGLIWVLTKMRIRYVDSIEKGRRLTCTTYPVEQKRATFIRDFYINYYEDGADLNKALVKGTSQWCVVNFETRRLGKLEVNLESLNENTELMERKFPKIHASEPKFAGTHTVDSEDIDFNDHCNNSRYMYIAEKVSGKSVTKEIYVNFASETRLGEKFDLMVEEKEGRCYVEGRKGDGTLVFQTEFN